MGTLQTTVLRIKVGLQNQIYTVQTTSTLANRHLACYQSDKAEVVVAYSKYVLLLLFSLRLNVGCYSNGTM